MNELFAAVADAVAGMGNRGRNNGICLTIRQPKVGRQGQFRARLGNLPERTKKLRAGGRQQAEKAASSELGGRWRNNLHKGESMFNAEQLLGKIVGEVVGKSGGSWGGGKKSMLSGLGSGSGLMTMIGLGVGAYEILKQQQEQKSQTSGMGQTPPPPPGSGSFGAPPPPPGGRPNASPPPPPMQTVPASPPATAVAPAVGSLGGHDLAVRMIQVMAAAAHADGVMDAEEERAVLDRLRGADLSQEEKMFLLNELHQPKSIEALVAGVSDPAMAQTMYMLAAAAISVDTEAERAWLDELAGRLGLSKEMQSFIETPH